VDNGWANTKVIMAKSYSPTALFRFLTWLFTLVAAMALQTGLLAQESALMGSDQARGGPSANLIETARLSIASSGIANPTVVNPAVVDPDASSSLPDAPGMPALAGETAAPATAFAPIPAPVIVVSQPTHELGTHRFWDRENMILFAAVGGMAGADFYVTHGNLASGGRELNPVTRILSGSTAGLATNFALESGGIIAVSYLFHKTGHHRLERLTSVVNVASSAGAVTYGFTHR
jgi:hypothetical protein